MIAPEVFDGLDFGSFTTRARALRTWLADVNPVGIVNSQKPASSPVATAQTALGGRTYEQKPRSGLMPVTGARAAQPMSDDEERRRRPAPGGAGGGSPKPLHKPQSAVESPARSGGVKREGLAQGSQVAVVKIASFASGRARTGALLTYQSHGGELSLEAQDGSQVQGREAIQSLVAQWQGETPSREPSKDVLSFTLTLEQPVSQDEAAAALKEAISGHRYAYRIEARGEGSALHVVMSAASSQRSEEGRAVRIFDNKKSLGGLEDRLSDSFGQQVTFQSHGFVHGVEGAALRLSRLTKGGTFTALTEKGREVSGADIARLEAKTWKRDLRSTEQRDIAHIIFSAKPGTDKDAFLGAVRTTLEREFGSHEYVFALHTNRQHIHVHAAVKMQSRYGERLDPKIQDLNRWRETLAQEARQRQIPMEAVSRFEQAHVPGYKLKDIRRVERGTAPESARRRVEASRTRAIHIPTREEGRRRANETASAWSVTAMARATSSEPARPDETIRLYRAVRPGSTSTAPLFALERQTAETLAASFKGHVAYLDVPRSQMSQVTPSRTNEAFVHVSARLATGALPLTPPENGRVLELSERTRIAAETAREQHTHQNNLTGDTNMPSLEQMTQSLGLVKERVASIVAAVPEEHRPRLAETAKLAVQDLEQGVETQRQEAERRRPSMDGNTHVPPKREDIGAFRHRVTKNDTVEYYRETEDGPKVAFTDNGQQVKIHDWKDRETVLTALKLSDEKWGALTIAGGEAYKSIVVTLAAEHGFKVTNPELQERIEAERQRLGKAEVNEIREGKVQTEKADDKQAQDKPTQDKPAQASGETQAKADKQDAGAQPVQRAGEAERQAPVGVKEHTPDNSQTDTLTVKMRALEARANAKDDPLRPEAKPQGVDRDQAEALKERQREIESRANAKDTQPEKPVAKPEKVDVSKAEKAEVLTSEPAKPEGQSSHTNKAEQGRGTQADQGVSGIISRIGVDHYKNDPKNDKSGFVDVANEEGQTQRIWSNDVHEKVRQAEARPGDLINAQRQGKAIVQKEVKVTNEQTGEVTRETRPVERGVWEVKVERQTQEHKPEAQMQKADPEGREKAERQTHKPRHKQ